MKLQIASDLHLDFYTPGPIEDFQKNFRRVFGREFMNIGNVDVLVLAGDFGPLPLFKRLMEEVSVFYPQVVFVLGNHDFWNHSFKETSDAIDDAIDELNNVHWLNNDFVSFDNQRFYGGTMWFPRTENVHEILQKRHFPDFRLIKNFEADVYIDNLNFENGLKKIDEGTIVISHHLPLNQSIDPKFVGNSMNCFFLNDCSELISEKEPKIWIHGHTHSSNDYTWQKKTRVVCNPFGYPRENARCFTPQKIIEV